MSDWIDDLVQKTKQRYDDQRVQDQKFVIESQQKQAAGKRFMESFYEHANRSANDFNNRIGGDQIISVTTQGTSVTLHAKPTRQETRTIEVTYNEPSFAVSLSQSQPV